MEDSTLNRRQASEEQTVVHEQEAINNANWILNASGLKERVTDLTECSASMFLVVTETLFGIQLPNIRRYPKTSEDHLHNCKTLLRFIAKDVTYY